VNIWSDSLIPTAQLAFDRHIIKPAVNFQQNLNCRPTLSVGGLI
jgi:hypothetical protein